MKIQSRFKFTDPIFFDGVAWNYLKFDDFKNTIEAHIILNSKDRIENLDGYLAFMNIADKNVLVDLINDELVLSYDHGKCIVKLLVFEKKKFFFKRKYIRAIYKYSSRNIEHSVITKLKNPIQKVGNPKWDIIADYLNKAI